VLDAGLRGHPDEPELVDLRNRVQRQRQQYEQAAARQAEHVRDLLNRGFAEDALKVADNALAMYSRAGSLLDLQRECRQRVDVAKTKAGELAQVQESVDKLIAAGQFQAAENYVLELHEDYQNQNELNKLLARILQAKRDAEKQAAVSQYMSQAEQTADAGEWEQALTILDGALSRFPGELKLQNLKRALNDRWQAELRRRAVEAVIAEARSLELSGSKRAARDRLARDLDNLDRDAALLRELARIDEALEAARREASIETAFSAAAGLQRERKWQNAIELLDRTTASEGGDARLEELRATLAAELHGHQALVSRAAADARQYIQDDQWEDAVLRLSTALRELPGERFLTDLMQEAQRGLAQKRRAETIARIKLEAERCAGALDYPEALRLLLDAVSQYPEDEILSAALSQTIFERDSYLTRERVKAALKSSYALREEGRYEAAVEVLQGALLSAPGDNELQSALSELERAWREFRLRQTIQEVSAAVQTSLDSENYQPAFDRLAQGLAEWPGEPGLLELERRARAAQRQTAVHQALSGAREQGKILEEALRWGDLARLFERTLSEFPETASELGGRISAARAREADARRKARIAELEHSVTEWIESGLLEEGDEELRVAEREFAGEPVFTRLREALTEERRRLAREAAIKNALDSARRFLERQSFDEAVGVLRATEREFGSDAALSDLSIFAEAAKRTHLAAIQSALAVIQALFDERDWDRAISVAGSNTEQFPDEPRFRALLIDARQNRESEKRRNEIDRRILQIDALLGEDAFDDVEVLIRNGLRDYPGEAAFTERSRRLQEERQAHAQKAAFRETGLEVQRLRQERQWERARQLVMPYRDVARTQTSAGTLLAELSAEEAQYRTRVRELEERARTLTAAKQHEEALALLEQAAGEFPEVGAFAHLLEEVRAGSAAEKKAGRLASAERTIRSLLAMRRYEEALAVADAALGAYPGEKALLDLRALIVAGIEEKAAVAGVAGMVRRLIAAGEGAEADRVLVDGFRRYPDQAELAGLRAAVDAVRRAEWDRKSREAGLKRAMAGVEKLLGKGKLAEAGAALEALEKEYGEGSAPGAALRISSAVAERERETERRRLAEEQRQREADRQSLAAEERQREAERQRLAAEEQRRRQEEERRAAALEAAFRQSAGEVGRLCHERQWGSARQLLAPYLEDAGTQPRALVELAELAKQEALYRARIRELEEQALILIGANRYQEALAMLEPSAREFPEVTALLRLRGEAREGLAAEVKAQRLRAAERTIHSRMVEQRYDDALLEADAALGDYPGAKAMLDLRATIVSAIEDAAVTGVAGVVKRLIGEGEGTEADRILVDGLRRYPGRAELSTLRPEVDTVRKAFRQPVDGAGRLCQEHRETRLSIKYSGEPALRALRTAVAAGIQEKAAVAGVAGEVLRLLAAGDGIQADRVLVESLRRYPGRAELASLRPAVEAWKTGPSRKSPEAGLKRAMAGIGKLLGKGKSKMP